MNNINEDESATSRKLLYRLPFLFYQHGLGDSNNVEEINVVNGLYTRQTSFTNYVVNGDVYAA